MQRAIRNMITFLRSDTGKAASGLLLGVISFCFPQLPAYAVGSACFYYAINRFTPVAAWIVEDIRNDMEGQ